MTLYAAIIYTTDIDWSLPEHSDVATAYGAFGAAAAAVIRGGAALYPTATATQVRVDEAGSTISTDGPYAETKEALTGFFLLECADLDEAVAWAAQIPAASNGVVEVRPVIPMAG